MADEKPQAEGKGDKHSAKNSIMEIPMFKSDAGLVQQFMKAAQTSDTSDDGPAKEAMLKKMLITKMSMAVLRTQGGEEAAHDPERLGATIHGLEERMKGLNSGQVAAQAVKYKVLTSKDVESTREGVGELWKSMGYLSALLREPEGPPHQIQPN